MLFFLNKCLLLRNGDSDLFLIACHLYGAAISVFSLKWSKCHKYHKGGVSIHLCIGYSIVDIRWSWYPTVTTIRLLLHYSQDIFFLLISFISKILYLLLNWDRNICSKKLLLRYATKIFKMQNTISFGGYVSLWYLNEVWKWTPSPKTNEENLNCIYCLMAMVK